MKKIQIKQDSFLWALQSICAVHRKPFSLEMAAQQTAAPYTSDSLICAARLYGFEAGFSKVNLNKIYREQFPLVATIRNPSPMLADNRDEGHQHGATDQPNKHLLPSAGLALILQCDSSNLLVIRPGETSPSTLSYREFEEIYLGGLIRVTPRPETISDPEADVSERAFPKFGFRWFVPELLKHRRLWQEVLLASLAIQIVALVTPLFTQTIIDKVIAHRTESTLIVMMVGMAMFAFFSAGLSWLRQYLVLHTGNRVDAVLGASVFERLMKLPPMYFQQRPTGVIAARLQGIEMIREFIAGAAITLVLDLPFLLIFVAIMLYYSVMLTMIALGVLGLIVGLSLIVAPMFQRNLQAQFLLGARNQAFLTEYLVGMDTVKSLQLEPQLNSKYSGYLASYLSAGFSTKQLSNSYNIAANFLEQILSLLILAIGAYTVMRSAEFTIGMLIAFQMFTSKLSQPMLRLVGLWQQFQQARLSVDRLGDLMNAPIEPYSIIPARDTKRRGHIKIEQISFRYQEQLPSVYENLSMEIVPGQTIAIMGPSGSGKSTLAKLLQGFYQPSAGSIKIDGVDIRYLSANELRSYFGVVPQETTLFSGTIFENLQMASPDCTFEHIVAACQMAEIHTVIEGLPHGYQTEIGERGAGLSGGQRQRIAIARALLKRPNVLVFDEATSALDGPTAEQFAKTVNALKGKVTTLFITHGLPRGLKLDAVYRIGPNGAQRNVDSPSGIPAPVN